MSNQTAPYSPCPQGGGSPCVYYTYSHKKIISGGVFFIAPVAFMFTLLILLLFIQMRRLSNRQRQLAAARNFLQQETQYPPEVLSSVGLTKEAIEAFPVKSFSVWKAEQVDQAATENSQCPVCLCEYEDTEILRILPCHAFHSECVDAWLSNHTTCPICRTSFGPPEPELHNPTSSSWYTPPELSSHNSIALRPRNPPETLSHNSPGPEPAPTPEVQSPHADSYEVGVSVVVISEPISDEANDSCVRGEGDVGPSTPTSTFGSVPAGNNPNDL